MKVHGTPTNPSRGLENIPALLALAVLVDRLGGEVIITQADIDKVGYGRLLEGWTESGSAVLRYVPLKPSA
jgi:hypothetical protein